MSLRVELLLFLIGLLTVLVVRRLKRNRGAKSICLPLSQLTLLDMIVYNLGKVYPPLPRSSKYDYRHIVLDRTTSAFTLRHSGSYTVTAILEVPEASLPATVYLMGLGRGIIGQETAYVSKSRVSFSVVDRGSYYIIYTLERPQLTVPMVRVVVTSE